MNQRLTVTLVVTLLLTVIFGWAGAELATRFVQTLLEQPDGTYVSALLQKHALKNPQLHTVTWYAEYIPAVITRVLSMLYITLAFALVMGMTERGRRYLKDFWNTPSTAFNLGVLRIAALIDLTLYDPGKDMVRRVLSLTYEGMNIPFGYSVFRSVLPPPAWFVEFLVTVYPILGALVLVGLFTRVTLPLFTLVAFPTLLFPQFVGKMNHYHHMWLILVFLSCSPCADALSLDALIARWRGGGPEPHVPHTKYGRPMVYLWCLLGAVYYFPGFWKFAAGGWAWAFSDNVQLKIITKIWETGQQPVLPLHNYPVLCQLGGLATLILEFGFPFAMFFPIPRLLFAAGAIGFHEGNKLITQISFASIEWFYVSFVNWSRLLRRPQARLRAIRDDFPAWQTALCAVMVAGLWVTGFAAIETWPWACYPTFAPVEERFVNSIEMRLIRPDASVTPVLLQDDPTLIDAYGGRTRLRAYMTLVMMEQDLDVRGKMLASLFDLWQKAHAGEAIARIEFWQVQVPLLPLGAPPVPFKELGQIAKNP